jgi:L-asparagine oxygenase
VHARTEVLSIALSSQSAQGVLQAISDLTADPYRDAERFIEQAQTAAQRLPLQVTDPLDEIARHEGPVAIHVTGLRPPVALSRTPTSKFDALSNARPTGTEPVVATLGARLGEIFGYMEWDSGHLVQNRYPVAGHRSIQAASGSSELVMHTESSFADLTPDHLVLLGLREGQADAVPTLVADIAEVFARLPESARAVLRSPAFVFETDNGDYVLDGRRTTAPSAIVTDHEVHYSMPLAGITPAAEQALHQFGHDLTAAARPVVLGPGEVLVIDNRRAVHGRPALAPLFDGTDRWIQRVLVRRALPAPGRVFTDSRMTQYPSAYRATLAQPS